MKNKQLENFKLWKFSKRRKKIRYKICHLKYAKTLKKNRHE